MSNYPSRCKTRENNHIVFVRMFLVKIRRLLKNIFVMLPFFLLCKINLFSRMVSFKRLSFLFRKPVSRAEVLKLKHTMNALLERITIEDNDLQGQTQVKSMKPKHFIITCFFSSFTIYLNSSKKNKTYTILFFTKSFAKLVFIPFFRPISPILIRSV